MNLLKKILRNGVTIIVFVLAANGQAFSQKVNNQPTIQVNIPEPFITTWKVSDNNIIIPAHAVQYTYNYQVEYRKKGATDYIPIPGNQTQDCSISGLVNGDTIEVSISGTFPQFFMQNRNDQKLKLLTVEAWGNIVWQSMEKAFEGCANLKVNATDAPDLSNVTNLSNMFYNCSSLNSNFNHWNTSNITNMGFIFRGATIYNQPLNNWNTANVWNMAFMFYLAGAFNQPLNNWNTSNVTNMALMFANTSNSDFNQDISTWDVSKVYDLSDMFNNATSFNQNLGSWIFNTIPQEEGPSVGLGNIFFNSGMDCANYSSTLTGWAANPNVPSDLYLASGSSLKYGTDAQAARDFLTSTKSWNIQDGGSSGTNCLPVTAAPEIVIKGNGLEITDGNETPSYADSTDFGYAKVNEDSVARSFWILNTGDAALELDEYPVSFSGRSKVFRIVQPTVNTIAPGDSVMFTIIFKPTSTNLSIAEVRVYSNDADESEYNFIIQGTGGLPFVTVWKTDNNGSSNNTSINIPTGYELTYNYDVDWNNDGVYDDFGITGSITHDYGTAGTYTVAIRGTFPRIWFGNSFDRLKLLEIRQWGTIEWTTMEQAFWGCKNLTIPAVDAPDLSRVENLSNAFMECESLNQNIGHWNTSNVKNMSSTFSGAITFDKNINSWDVSNVIQINAMFYGATAFNQPLGLWNTSKITSMRYVFTGATSFNQDLSNWNTANVTDMTNMFEGATSFNQALGNWNTANVTSMNSMFKNSTNFDHKLSGFELNPDVFMDNMLDNSGISLANYDSTLIEWVSQDVFSRNLGAAGLKYCSAETSHNRLTNSVMNGGKGWTITGDAIDCAVAPPTDLSFSPSAVCMGDSVTLSATCASGVVNWYGSGNIPLGTGPTFKYKTASVGYFTYFATCKEGSEESNQSATSSGLIVRESPIASVLSPITVCEGQTINFDPNSSARIRGISGVGPAETYAWVGPNSFQSSDHYPVINSVVLVNSGVYTLTVANEYGCSATATSSVTINPIPKGIITSLSEICERETLTFSVVNTTSTDTLTYAWEGPNGFNSSLSQPSIVNSTPAASGTYSLTLTNQKSCSSVQTTIITVNALPAAPTISANNSSICKGDNAILTGTCSSATDIFRWQTPPSASGNFTSALGNTNQRTVSGPGTYKGFCESAKGCLGDVQSITITEGSNCNPANYVTITPAKPVTCPGESVTLTARGCSGTITWYGGPSTITGNTLTVNPAATSSYFASCSTGGSASVDVAVATTAVNGPPSVTTGVEKVKAVNTIVSNARVGDVNYTPAPNVTYEAGNSITLNPGFIVEKYAVFKAEIKKCN